jgi:uncharacterized protein (TIGR00369 family)
MSQPLPYSTWCYVCGKDNPLGLHIVFRADGETVTAEFTGDAARQGYPGKVHGGVLSALLDETMGWAPTLRTRRMCVTAELTVRFLKPAPAGQLLRVSGRCVDSERRLFSTEGDIVVAATGEVVARGSGKYAPLSETETAAVDRLLLYDPETLRVFAQP